MKLNVLLDNNHTEKEKEKRLTQIEVDIQCLEEIMKHDLDYRGFVNAVTKNCGEKNLPPQFYFQILNFQFTFSHCLLLNLQSLFVRFDVFVEAFNFFGCRGDGGAGVAGKDLYLKLSCDIYIQSLSQFVLRKFF